MQGIPHASGSRQNVDNAREKPKRGAGSRFEQLRLPLQTILRAIGRNCSAESAIFPKVVVADAFAGHGKA
jgi:hypothetical protein